MIMRERFFQSIISSSYWSRDIGAALTFVVFFGRFVQNAVDNQEKNSQKLIAATIVGVVSYLLPALLSLRFERIPSWVWIGGFGSLLYAFNWAIVYFLIVNWNSEKEADGVIAYLSRVIPLISPRFIYATIAFTISVILLSFTSRVIVVVTKMLTGFPSSKS